MKKIKLFSAFAGYGTDNFALKQLKIPFECVGYSEIDKYAIQCFEQNHKGKNYGDITKINPKDLPDFDLFTGGFPCQSFSVAGKRKGELDPRGTLFYDIIRICEVKKPKYMLLENVKGLTFKNHRKTFEKILSELKRIGYDVRWKILNTKNYGIPQNRERIFFVCFRKDIKQNFEFPKEKKLKIFLKDVLEDEVDDKYYLSRIQIKKVKTRNKKFNMKGTRIISDEKNCFSGLTCNISHNDILITHSLYPRSGNPDKRGTGHLSKIDGTSYCVDTGNCQCIEISPWLTTELAHSTAKDWNVERFKKVTGEYRKLTPKECFRLQGFLKDEVNLEGLSNTQIYKLAGNGQSVNVVKKIFKEMFKNRS